MRRPALALLALSTTLAGLTLAGPAARATNAVAPRQPFAGRVNGSFSDATVTVICPGPGGGPGRKGHPASGQQLEVLSPLPPVSAGVHVSVGHTGTAGRAIVARFTDEASVATTFRQYFVTKAIPTTLLLPCGGTGKVVFRPMPSTPAARSSVVSVTYVNPAA